MAQVLAFDLGGTRLKVGLVDTSTGVVKDAPPVDVAGAAAEEALTLLERVGADLVGATDLDAVGLGVPGLVEGGVVHALPGKFPGIEGIDLAGRLRADFGVPADVVNDAVAYGAGEVVAGAGVGVERVAVVTIGTGVGCAVFQRGRPITDGLLGGGILGGHIPVGDPVGPLDTNGKPGTFEARCRALRIVEEAREAGADVADVPAVYAAAAAGDSAALQGLASYRRWLVRGLVGIVHAYTPGRIVLGGGPLTEDTPLVDGLADEVAALVWPNCQAEVRRALLGDHASLLGAAHLSALHVGLA